MCAPWMALANMIVSRPPMSSKMIFGKSDLLITHKLITASEVDMKHCRLGMPDWGNSPNGNNLNYWLMTNFLVQKSFESTFSAFRPQCLTKMSCLINIHAGWLVPFFWIFTYSVHAQQGPRKLDNPTSEEYLLSNLDNQLPRLVLNATIEKNLKDKIKTNPILQNIYAAIKLNAEGILLEPIINLIRPWKIDLKTTRWIYPERCSIA